MLNSEALNAAVEIFDCLRSGSNFSAIEVRPTAKKRLEESPYAVWVIVFEFIGGILPQITGETDFEYSLNFGRALRSC